LLWAKRRIEFSWKVTVLVNHESAAPSLEVKAETKPIEQLPVFVVLGPTHSQLGDELVIRLMEAAFDLDQNPDDPFQSSRIASGHVKLLIAGAAGKHKCIERSRPPTGGPKRLIFCTTSRASPISQTLL
jgi:hypothetical protein